MNAAETVKPQKLVKAIRELETAYKRRREALTEYVIYAGIAKCFEVCLEYAWKYLKSRVEDQGLEAFAPKDIVKAAGNIGMIDNVESWIEFINARNFAVHDYLGVTHEEYLELIDSFLKEVHKLEKSFE